LIRAYTSFLLDKLQFHRHHPEFNGLFEYEEYISLKNIDDPNQGYETIIELMKLQDDIDKFQKLIFVHFRGSANNECRMSALVPLVKESFGIYKFVTSMLRAMFRRTDASDVLQPLRERYNQQHYNLRRFYYECSNLKYLTSLINVPKLGQEPPNLLQHGDAPELPERPGAAPTPVRNLSTPAPAVPRSDSPAATQREIEEQRRMLEEYERKQASLVAQRESDERAAQARKEREAAELAEFERQQAERQRLAQEQLAREQMNQAWQSQADVQLVQQLQQDNLGLRGQYERDQMLLQQYDGRVKSLEMEMASINATVGEQLNGKDALIAQLQKQLETWQKKYEALAKLYSQLRNEHLDLLSKSKDYQLKSSSAQEAIDKMERMERDMKAKNLELADMIRERDRSRYDLDRLKASHKDQVSRLERDRDFAHERAEDASRNKSSEVRGMMDKYNRQLTELEDSLRVSFQASVYTCLLTIPVQAAPH
jgi:hypothetical protein